MQKEHQNLANYTVQTGCQWTKLKQSYNTTHMILSISLGKKIYIWITRADLMSLQFMTDHYQN